MLGEFFDWHRAAKGKANPVEPAALARLKSVAIHPFADGNGRFNMLMTNFVLRKEDFPMLNIEYKKRNAYYRSLERSQTRNDERPCLNWLFRRYKSEYRRYLADA